MWSHWVAVCYLALEIFKLRVVIVGVGNLQKDSLYIPTAINKSNARTKK